MTTLSSRWLGHDIRGLTLGKVLADRAASDPKALFIRDLDKGVDYSYEDAVGQAQALHGGLQSLGIGYGSRVALMMATRPENIWLQVALGQLGAIVALVNTAARGELLRHYLRLVGATHVIAEDIFAGSILEVCASLGSVQHLVLYSTGGDSATPPAPAGLTLTGLDQLRGQAIAQPLPEVRFSDPALILFTSGTTGPSKGVLYTHGRSLMYALDSLLTFGVRTSDRMFCWAPLFHLSGLQSCVLTAMIAGASVAMTSRFVPDRILEQARESEATVLMLPGASLNMLWGLPPSPRDRDHRLRLCSSVPLPAFAQDFERRFGFRLTTAYGLTDCGMPTAFGPTDPQSKMGSAGRARDGWSLRVVDEDDFDLPTGEVGQILIRCERPWGHSSGYFENPQATVDAWRNGWFHTGDRGRLDEDNYLWFVGRSKDAIRRRGENISAYEVEEVLVKHAAVAEAAAFPLPSQVSEEEVAVAVILREGASATEAELVEHCIREMPHYMVPRYVQFVTDLPRTLTQKVQKFKLIEQATAVRETLWDREQAGIRVPRPPR